MTVTSGLAIVFAVLLVLEWRYRLKTLRLAAAVLAVAALWFFQPLITNATRAALARSPAERERVPFPGASDYEKGVFAMAGEVSARMNHTAGARRLSAGVLFWLACSPVFRRAPARSSAGRPEHQAGPELPHA